MKKEEQQRMLTILTQLKGRWNRKAPFRTALEQTFRLGLNEHGDTISPDALFSLGIDTALSVCRKKDRSWLINQLKNLKLAHQGVPREGLLKNRRSYDLPTLFDQALKVYKRNRFAI